MSFTLDSRRFITTFINKDPLVKSSRLDKTLKALINKYRFNNIKRIDTLFIIGYLNKLRIIYYLKRLDYYNRAKALRLKGIYLILLITFKLILYRSYRKLF